MRHLAYFSIFFLFLLFIGTFFNTQATGNATLGTQLYIANHTYIPPTEPSKPPPSSGGGRGCDIQIYVESSAHISEEIVAGKRVCYILGPTNETGSINVDNLGDITQIKFNNTNLTYLSDGVSVAYTLSNKSTIYITKEIGPDGKPILFISLSAPNVTSKEIGKTKVTLIELDENKKVLNRRVIELYQLPYTLLKENAIFVLIQFEGDVQWYLLTKADTLSSETLSGYSLVKDKVSVSSDDITKVRITLASLVIGGIFYVQTHLKPKEEDQSVESN